MKPAPIPTECRGCHGLHTGGARDGRHDRWCCQFGAPAPRMIGHCKTTRYYDSDRRFQRNEEAGRLRAMLVR